MSRRVRVIFYALCGTSVALAFWIVIVVFNLVGWLLGEAPFVRPLLWTIFVVSTPIFFVIAYKYFDRAEP
jgi:hypothetical protein